jgi:hypothetical protein
MSFAVSPKPVFAQLCILALPLLALPGAVQAGTSEKGSPEQRCRNEFNRYPDCTRRERQRINALFGLPPLETLYRKQPKGSDLIIASATFKLGGGLAMVFQKDRSGKPSAEIRRTPIAGLRPKSLRVSLSEDAWRAITAKSRVIDTNRYEDDSICTGGASFNLQTIDHLGTYRARLGDVCGEHPGNWFFDQLAELALSELPLCASLAPEGYGEAWAGSKLYDCFLLGGEMDLAVAAYNFLEGTSFWSTWNSDEDGTRMRLAEAVAFTWPGSPLPESGKDLARILTEQRFDAFRLEATAYAGEAVGRVRVSGKIRIRSTDEGGREYQPYGTFRSVWVKQANGGFKLSSFAADAR